MQARGQLVTEEHNGYKWKPIEPLSKQDREIDLAAIQPLYESWRSSKDRLEKSSVANLRDFNERLVRRLSIETGILERLYDLDRGTTEALIAHGFVEDLVSRSSTDIEPSRLIDLLRDQEAAVRLTMDCVAQNRELTIGVIHELHSILTRHQDQTLAVDQFGRRYEIPLLKGRFKEQPNNPKRPDGSLHEYCPPLHVQSEMENLLGLLSSYAKEDPVIVAAWLHHRFTQIHPYQDGNGRVARAITTLVLLRSDLLPLVIDRDLRAEYIDALESADYGSLSALATMFAGLERKAILQALSVDIDAAVSNQKTLTSAVIESLATKFNKRREEKSAELRRVNNIAAALRTLAHRIIEDSLDELKEPISELAEPQVYIVDGGPDHGNGHWYRFEVGTSAREAGKVANLTEAHYFVKASFRVERERLVFVTSFHHVGRELSGIMEATAFRQFESFEDAEDRERALQSFSVCSVEPFVFTYKTKQEEIQEAFSRWLDQAIAIALKEFGDRL
jgi:hypothetical protein